MRAVFSNVGSASYGTLKYLVKIIQPILNKIKHRVTYPSSFVKEAKGWNVPLNKLQTSFDVVNFYPTVPIDEAVAVIIK